MGIKVGIEPTLTPIRDYLSEKGYNVVNISRGVQEGSVDYTQFDAIVVTGMNENFLNMQDTVTSGIVINASGLTPSQVEREIENRVRE